MVCMLPEINPGVKRVSRCGVSGKLEMENGKCLPGGKAGKMESRERKNVIGYSGNKPTVCSYEFKLESKRWPLSEC